MYNNVYNVALCGIGELWFNGVVMVSYDLDGGTSKNTIILILKSVILNFNKY